MKIANFERRVVSYLIDLAISVGFSFLLYYLCLVKVDLFIDFNLFVVILISSSIVNFVINSILCFTSNGYTIGNLFTKIKMTSLDQNRIRIKETLLKYCFLCFPICVIVNVFYMLIVHSQKTIFDILSNTVVISTKKEF